MFVLLLFSSFTNLQRYVICEKEYTKRNNRALRYFDVDVKFVSKPILNKKDVKVIKIMLVFIRTGYLSSNL